MRKVIAGINMTLDGFCDHTAVDPSDDVVQHYNDLLSGADVLVYGRITYQLMEDYWPVLVKKPSGNKADDDFAKLIDNITKIVYSHTLKKVVWKKSLLRHEINTDEILELKQQKGNNILVGSPSMIVQFLQLDLIDELQIMVHPVILGKGLPLFMNISDKVDLKLTRTKKFDSGAVLLYYKPALKTNLIIEKKLKLVKTNGNNKSLH